MKRLCCLSVAALLLSAPAAAAEIDPFTGVWTYDPAQSRGGPGEQVLTITVRGQEETYLSDWSNRQGRRSILAFVVRYDGVPVPATTYNIAPDGTITARPMEVAAKVVDSNHRVIEHRVDGRVVRRLDRSRTADGRVMVSEMTDFNAEGQETNTARLVFVATDPAD